MKCYTLKLTHVVAFALSAGFAFIAAHGEATARDRDLRSEVVRDHRTGPEVRDHRSAVIVRDHRTQPIVRDHRTQPIIRDHRATPIVRDHRTSPMVRDHRQASGPQGGVVVTSSERRGGSQCIRSVFGGPCVGF